MRSATLLYNSRHVLRRRLWISVLLCVAVFLFGLPLSAVFNFEYAADQWEKCADLPQVREIISCSLNQIFEVTYAGTAIPLMLSAFVVGMIFFGFLHSRRRVDFFHSLPMNRTQLFCTQYAAGAASVLLPYLLNLLLTVVIALLMGLGEALHLPTILSGLGLNILLFLCVYSLVVFATILTGHLVVNILMSLYLLTLAPAAVVLFYFLRQTFYPTWFSLLDWTKIACYGSPIFRWGVAVADAQYAFTPLSALLLGLAAVVLTLLALYFYKKRPAESAGKALAFSWLRPLIKYPVAVLGMTGVGLIFYEVSGKSIGWFVLGAVLCGLICCQGLEILYRFDFSCVRRRLLPACGLIALFCGVCLCGFFDVTGYNTYIPAEDEISSIHIQIDGTEISQRNNVYRDEGIYFSSSFPSQYNSLGSEELRNVSDYGKSREGRKIIRQDTEVLEVKDPLAQYLLYSDEAKQAALSLAQASIDWQENGGDDYYIRYSYENSEGELVEDYQIDYGLPRFSVCIRYTLNNGREVQRCYGSSLYAVDYLEELDTILADADYRRGQQLLFDHPRENVWLESANSEEDWNYNKDYYGKLSKSAEYTEQTAALLDVLEQEFCALDGPALRKDRIVGTVHFRAYAASVAEISQNSYRPYISYNLPIYESMEGSIAALEAFGMEPEDFHPDLEHIVRLYVHQGYYNVRYCRGPLPEQEETQLEAGAAATEMVADAPVPTGEFNEDDLTQTITDPEEIRQWMEQSFCSIWNTRAYDPVRDIQVVYMNDEGEEQTQYRNLPHPAYE